MSMIGLKKTLLEKEKMLVPSIFSFLYPCQRRDVLWDHPWRPSRHLGGQAASSSLSGAYLQNYTSYGYEILWVDRSYQGRVQRT